MKALTNLPIFFVALIALTNPTLAQQSTSITSVLRELSIEDAQMVFFGLRYYRSESSSKLSQDAALKVGKLIGYLGNAVPADPRPENVSIGDHMEAKRKRLYEDFSAPNFLLDELTRAATTFNSPNGKVAGAHILDLVITIDPTKFEAAYQLEKIFIIEKISANWDGQFNQSRSDDDDDAMVKNDDLMRESLKGIYKVDFSKLSLGTTSSGSNFAGLSKNQALIKGLLVQELSGSQFAGQASQMNATVLGKIQNGGTMAVHFNQKVGSTMTEAIEKTKDFLKSRHGTLPEGIEVELSFEEQYIPKDGPSAGVACTLLLESLLKGHEYSPSFAVTGAMSEKGVVEGVGGIDGKIRGAIARNCELVAIPSENEMVIQDMLILEGPVNLAKIQIIEIETFDQALPVAKTHESRPPEIKQAIESFAEVQKVVNKTGGLNLLSNQAIQDKLRSILKVMPNHLSAKYLLLKGMGRQPTGLTLAGSIQAIDRNAAPLINALKEGNFEVQDSLGKDSFAQTISALNRVRPLLDERTRPFSDSIVTFSGFVRTAINTPPKSPSAITDLRNNLRASGRNVNTENEKLYKRPDVKKELMIEDEEDLDK